MIVTALFPKPLHGLGLLMLGLFGLIFVVTLLTQAFGFAAYSDATSRANRFWVEKLPEGPFDPLGFSFSLPAFLYFSSLTEKTVRSINSY